MTIIYPMMKVLQHIKYGINLNIRKWKDPPSTIYNCGFDDLREEYPEPSCIFRYYIPIISRPVVPIYKMLQTRDEISQNNKQKIGLVTEAYTDIRHFVCGTIIRTMFYSCILSTLLLHGYILYNILLFLYRFDNSWYYYQKNKKKDC